LCTKYAVPHIAAAGGGAVVQLGPQQIRVNALAPGPIMTAHVEQFFPAPQARRLRLDRIRSVVSAGRRTLLR
jgi:NAD(P)-dependent dehydrogenase (short-subunit alcohol dehydrogenase family)